MTSFNLPVPATKERLTNSNPGNCISINSGCIGSGEFILHRSRGAAFDANAKQQLGSCQPAQPIAIADRRDVSSNEKSVCMEEAGDGRGDRLVLIRHCQVVSCQNSSLRPNPGVHFHIPDTLLEVKATSEVQWTPLQLTETIAFVFQLDAIQDGRCNCSGIRNAFFIRTEMDEEGKELSVSEDAFNPFCCPHGVVGESFSKRIWNGLTASQELIFGAASAKGNWDGRNKHVHVVGSNYELFECVTMSVRSNGGGALTEKECSFKRGKKRPNALLRQLCD